MVLEMPATDKFVNQISSCHFGLIYMESNIPCSKDENVLVNSRVLSSASCCQNGAIWLLYVMLAYWIISARSNG